MWASNGVVLLSPDGGMGGLERGFGVADGRGAGLYSVVWSRIATPAEADHQSQFGTQPCFKSIVNL